MISQEYMQNRFEQTKNLMRKNIIKARLIMKGFQDIETAKFELIPAMCSKEYFSGCHGNNIVKEIL